MDIYFNNLTQDEQRRFIIEKILSDDLFKEYHVEFIHKYTELI